MTTHRDATPPPSTPRAARTASGVIPRAPELGDMVREEANAHLALGDALLAEGERWAALRAYLRAVMVFNRHAHTGVVDAYLRLDEVARPERPGAAFRYLERARAVAPSHPEVLQRLIHWHVEHADWGPSLDEVETSLFATWQGEPEALFDELLRSGDRWWRRAGDPARARRRYEAALRGFPESERARARLRALTSSLAVPASDPPPAGQRTRNRRREQPAVAAVEVVEL